MKKHKSTRLERGLIAVLVFMTGTALIALEYFFSPKVPVTQTPATPQPSASRDKTDPWQPMEENEMLLFWNVNLRELVQEKLLGVVPRYEVAAVAQEAKRLKAAISVNYQQDLNLSLSRWFHTGMREVFAGASLNEKGAPQINLFVPMIATVYVEIAKGKSPTWKNDFHDTVTTYVLHELYHVERKHLSIKNPTLNQKIRGESEAWGDTCEYVIAPLISAGFAPPASIQKILIAWHGAGRSRTSPKWTAFMKDMASH